MPTRSQDILEFARSRLAELLGTSDPPPMRQSVLLREGFYVGYRFHCEGWIADWRGDLRTLEIRRPSGEVARQFPLPGAGSNGS